MRAQAILLLVLFLIGQTAAQELEPVTDVSKQPLVAATKRMVVALESAGSPLSKERTEALNKAFRKPEKQCVLEIQKVLDPLCLAHVEINAESRVKVRVGQCKKELLQHGWRAFLVKVHNMARINPLLVAESPNSAPVFQQGKWPRERPRTAENLVDQEDVADRFLTISMLDRPPLQRKLSGLNLEYRVLLLYCRDAGDREVSLSFHIGAGTKDIGFRNAVPILFNSKRAVKVGLDVKDFDGKPTTASFEIVDRQGRVYPHQSRRLAPDFFFHRQVYRSDGESVWLPPGDYSITVSRGPEYLPKTIQTTVPDEDSYEFAVKLERWIHLAKRNWFSGDHHIHAAGCSHYDSPTEGVGPEAMMRHVIGEDLNVGNVLSWGPCWYTQKRYFNGDVSKLSTPENILRYDVEVSGFPSSHCGHLCLLKLAEDDYPDADNLEDWPSWTLPVLKWGKEQGGIVGYSHSGWGIALPDFMPDGSRAFPETPWGGAPHGWRGIPATLLPDYSMPRFDGIGANEYIVTVAHGVCDFISTVDTPAWWELNIWYHTLNCGMTARISGETDFPCIYDSKVGLGRVYVKFPEDVPLNYNTWVDGLRDGRSYVSDGLSHIMDFSVNGLGVGEKVSEDSSPSRLDLSEPGKVKLKFEVAALLQEKPDARTESIRNRRPDEKPYWHIERCRIGVNRMVPVEIIVNGEVVKTEALIADGKFNSIEAELKIEQSSWVAVRILPSSHTNPVFVHVQNQPIRANARSAQWCIDAVKECWESKKHQIRESEKPAATRAYDQASEIYKQILLEHERR